MKQNLPWPIRQVHRHEPGLMPIGIGPALRQPDQNRVLSFTRVPGKTDGQRLSLVQGIRSLPRRHFTTDRGTSKRWKPNPTIASGDLQTERQPRANRRYSGKQMQMPDIHP